jgi:3-(3-hydroxy-phenyl)propionate hydroxylase
VYKRQTHDFTQQQTIENMAIMRGGQGDAHAKRLAAMQGLKDDAERRRAYMLKQSMFTSLADAAKIV